MIVQVQNVLHILGVGILNKSYGKVALITQNRRVSSTLGVGCSIIETNAHRGNPRDFPGNSEVRGQIAGIELI